MCSAVFITGYDIEFARRARRLLHRARTRSEPRWASRSSTRQENGEHHAAQRRHPHGGLHRRPGLHDAARGGRHAVVHAEDRVKPTLPAGRRHRTGRWATGCPRRRFPAELDEAKIKTAVDAAFESRGGDRGLRRHLEGPRRSASATARHHRHDAARELVDGQERDRHHHGHADPARASTRWISRRRFPSGRAPDDPRAQDPDRGHPADVERHPDQRAAAIPTSIRRAPIPITSTSTPAASTRSNTPRRARSSGRPTPWAAIATPIRCSSTT